MFRPLILCLLVACGSVSEPTHYPEPPVSVETDAAGVTTERVMSAPLPAPGHYPTVIYGGPAELGDWYAMVVSGGDATIELADTIVKRDGTVVALSECTSTGASVAVSARLGGGPPTGVPTSTGSVAGGLGRRVIRAPGPGPWLLAVQIGAGVCLRGIRGPDPLPAGREWWVTQTGQVRDMAQGGGSPQCQGPCPWYTTVTR